MRDWGTRFFWKGLRPYKKVIVVFTAIDLLVGSVLWLTRADAWTWIVTKLPLLFIFVFCFYVARVSEGIEATVKMFHFEED